MAEIEVTKTDSFDSRGKGASMIWYLARRFKYKGSKVIRQGETAYDLVTNRHWKIRLGEKKRG